MIKERDTAIFLIGIRLYIRSGLESYRLVVKGCVNTYVVVEFVRVSAVVTQSKKRHPNNPQNVRGQKILNLRAAIHRLGEQRTANSEQP